MVVRLNRTLIYNPNRNRNINELHVRFTDSTYRAIPGVGCFCGSSANSGEWGAFLKGIVQDFGEVRAGISIEKLSKAMMGTVMAYARPCK